MYRYHLTHIYIYVCTFCDVHFLIKHIGSGVRNAKYGVELHSQPGPRIAKWMGKLVVKFLRRQAK